MEFRWNSAAKEGTRRVDGPQFSRIGMWETVDAIKKSEHWKSPKDAKQPYDADGIEYAYGRGIASGFWFNAGLKSSVTATVRPDGTVSLVEGSTDIGDTRTSIAMQLDETLGIAAEDVHPTVADTDGVGYTDVTGGSRVTYATGWAAYEGAKDIERQLIERAAEIWETDSENVTYRNGTVHGPDGQSFTFKEFAKKLNNTGGPISGRGVSDHNEPGGAFATLLVDVAVDKETGKVKTSATPPRRMSARRFTPLMSKDKCRGESCRESAGHSTKNTFTTKTAQCKIPRFWITACRRANDRNADCRSCQSRPSLRRSGCG